jgi:hypothetical protein
MNWTPIMKKYAGKWVALKDDLKTVVASASTAKQALKNAQQKGVAQPFLNFIPRILTAFAGKSR